MINRPTTLRKLPLLSLVSQAYRTPLVHFRALARASWLWLALILPSTFLVYWTTWSWHPNAQSGNDYAGIAILWAEIIVPLPFLSSIAVAWHRFLLREEQVPSNLYLRLDRVVWSYALICLMYWASALVWPTCVLLWPEIYEAETTVRVAATATAIFLAGVFLVVGTRVSVMLPAVALEKHEVSWRHVWTTTRSNTWRLALGALLCIVPLLAGEQALFWYIWSDHRVGHALQATGHILLNAILVIVGVSFLSFTYRWFFEADETLSGPKS